MSNTYLHVTIKKKKKKNGYLPQVLEFQGDGEQNAWSWASPGWLNLSPTPLTAFTLCVYTLVQTLDYGASTVFSLANNISDNYILLGSVQFSWSGDGICNNNSALTENKCKCLQKQFMVIWFYTSGLSFTG